MKKDTILHTMTKLLVRNWRTPVRPAAYSSALTSALRVIRILSSMLIGYKNELTARTPRAYGSCLTTLRLVVLMLLLMVVGVSASWGQPFTVTTDTDNSGSIEESEKHYYFIQCGQVPTFYCTSISGDNKIVKTTNVPSEDMLWYFLDAGIDNNIQYYYIVHKSGRYLYKTKSDGDDDIKLATTPAADGIDKFYIEPTGDYYFIRPKGKNYVNKKSGNVNSGKGLKNSTATDNNSQWKFIAKDDLSWEFPFTFSTADEKNYYKIKNDSKTSFYISLNSTQVCTSNAADDDNMVWYFEQVPTEKGSNNYITYCYIVNAVTGKYMHFDGTVQDNSQDNACSVQTKTNENETRCQFIVVRSAKTTGPSNNPVVVECYAIIPRLLQEKIWNNHTIGQKNETVGTGVRTYSDRGGTADALMAQWNFEEVWGDPVVTCDENGTITITGEDGASFYYTTDGSTVPTTANSQYDATNKPTVSSGITTIKVRAIGGEKSPSRVITQKIVYVPNQTFASSTYNGTAQAPVVKVGETTISSNEYNISYKLGETDVTECKNAGTYTITITDKAGGEYIVYGSGSFTINKKALTVTAEAKSKTYGDPDALTYTSSGLVASDAISGALSRAEGEIVGTYAINKGTLTAGDNYNISYTGANLTITQKALTITANSDSKEYDGTALTNDGYTNTALAFNDKITSVTVTGSQTARGESDNEPSAAEIKSNNGNGVDVTACYNITYVNGTLSVTGRVIKITADSDTKVYDGTALIKNSYTYEGTFYSGDAITSVTVTGSQTVAGSSANVPSAAVIKNGETDKTANYDFNYVNGTLTVTQKALTITASSDSKVYDGTALTKNSYTNTDLATGDAFESVIVTGSQTVVGTSNNVPSAAVIRNAGSEDVTESYAITYTNGTLTVSAKALTITAGSDSKVYDGTELTKGTYTNTDLATGDAFESVTVTGSQTAVGTSNNVPSAAVIRNAGSEDVTESYAITYVNGTLEVTPKSVNAASITITIDKDENGYTIVVKDGETTLAPKPDTGDVYDYTITVDQSNPNYYKAIITGKNNYTGVVTVRYALTNFMNDGDQGTEWSSTFVAEEDHALPTGFKAYTVTSIDGNVVNVSSEDALTFIPKDVPVLLLSDTDHKGFRVEAPASTPDISALAGGNQLKVVNASTPNFDSDRKSAHFNVATIYLLYRDEFVLNKDSYLAEGKVYLPVPSGGAGARLRINHASSTGINGIQEDDSNRKLDDRWYSLDGRRLNGKPTKKGLYLKDGKKVVIK